jgi:prepilin-type N-terminal cleavage/methylation domain-containing protein
LKVEEKSMTTDYKLRKLNLRLHRQRHIYQDHGFTVLEVLIVVFMIGILSAIVAPSWLAFVNRQRLNKASDAVVSVIRQTQAEAKNKKLNYSVSFRVNSTSNVPEYIIYQGTPPATITTTTVPSSSNTSSSGWTTLGNDLRLQSREVFLYTNLTSLTAYNTIIATPSNIVTTATGTGTITFDYLGVLANKSSGAATDAPLKVMVSTPQSSSNVASNLKRCVIIETVIGGMRTAKDTNCL